MTVGRVSAAEPAVRAITDGSMGDGRDSAVYERFCRSMRERFGAGISEDALREMLTQYLALRPVLGQPDATTGNQIVLALEDIAAALSSDRADETSAAGIDQRVVEAFFNLTPAAADLGIVYTPPPIVDFMLRSAEAVLRSHFGVGLADHGVRVLDPFAGLGIFLERLVRLRGYDGSHVISAGDLRHKTTAENGTAPEWSAVEIVPLAAHLAAVQIESAISQRIGSSAGFRDVLLGDTFKLLAASPATLFDSHSSRCGGEECVAQVIVGNPPWGRMRQDSPALAPVAERVRITYVRRHREVTGRSPGGKAANNQFVAAFRWATDRLMLARRVPGVVVFVHPNSLAEAPSLAGMRACLEDEFTDVYVVNLLGDTRSQPMSLSAQGAKVFGQGSRNGIQITVLVNDPSSDRSSPSRIRYARVPLHASLNAKFEWLTEIGDVLSPALIEMERTSDDDHGWVGISDSSFLRLMPVCSETGDARIPAAVRDHTLGAMTKCDPFVYSFDHAELCSRMRRMIETYEQARRRSAAGMPAAESEALSGPGVKWTPRLQRNLRLNERVEFDENLIVECGYRPFHRMWMYADPRIVDMMPRDCDMSAEQIGITAPSKRTIFGALASRGMNDVHSTGIPTRLIPRTAPR